MTTSEDFENTVTDEKDAIPDQEGVDRPDLAMCIAVFA